MQVEEERTEALVGCRQEQQHDRERRVDQPVRNRPVPGRKPGETRVRLVRFGVASDVGVRVAERQDDHRRPDETLERSGSGEELRIAGHLEELPGLGGALQHEQVDSLAEPCRGRVQSCAQHTVQDLGRHRIVRIAPCHAALGYDVVQFHSADAN